MRCGWYIDHWSSGTVYIVAWRFDGSSHHVPLGRFARWFAGMLGGAPC